MCRSVQSEGCTPHKSIAAPLFSSLCRLCGGGDLFYLVRGTQLTEEQVKPLALQIIQARGT